jgi:hypothetical protein
MRRQHHAFVAALFVPILLVLVAPVFAVETNHKPCLCQPMIRPLDGVTRTTFVATVRYNDPDGDAPASVAVYIDGIAYPMQLVKGRAHDGIYRARLTLGEGEHNYYFYAEDVRGLTERFPRYGAKHGPYVGARKRYNRQAIMTSGGVHFDYGDERSIYTFTVHYRDRDVCRPPKGLTVIVDGIPQMMKLHKGTPNNGIYLYQTLLPAGPHAYYFVAKDGDGGCVSHPQHGYLRGPEVAETFNTPPTLSDNRTIPPSGSYRTKYTYTIHVKDEDFDVPSVALIYIDDVPFQLKLAAGKAYEGLYLYRTRHHVGWDHNYYFYFEDGRGGVARFPEVGTFHGPIVTR